MRRIENDTPARVESDGAYWKLQDLRRGFAAMTAFSGPRCAAHWGVARGFAVEGFHFLHRFERDGIIEVVDARRAIREAA